MNSLRVMEISSYRSSTVFICFRELRNGLKLFLKSQLAISTVWFILEVSFNPSVKASKNLFTDMVNIIVSFAQNCCISVICRGNMYTNRLTYYSVTVLSLTMFT
jgi:hypothetical protein